MRNGDAPGFAAGFMRRMLTPADDRPVTCRAGAPVICASFARANMQASHLAAGSRRRPV
jgi:hypothetical protein